MTLLNKGIFLMVQRLGVCLVHSWSDLHEFHHCMELGLYWKMFRRALLVLQSHRGGKCMMNMHVHVYAHMHTYTSIRCMLIRSQ